MKTLTVTLAGLFWLTPVSYVLADDQCASSSASAACALVGPCGDVNGSGELTSSDALTVLRAAVGQPVVTTCEVTGSFQPGQLPRTGQTTTYGSESDGAIRAGAPRSFTDNGDGTVTDDVTGLMWEKKDRAGGVHDKDNFYGWRSGSSNDLDGPLVTDFLATLNAGGGFAGHKDWRIPNVLELQSLTNWSATTPMVFDEFNSHCTPGCTIATCSCSSGYFYATSTTSPVNPMIIVEVSFYDGTTVAEAYKGGDFPVRAVRGGR